MSKLLSLLSTLSLIGALICFVAIKLPVASFSAQAQSYLPILLVVGIGAAVGSFFLKAISKLILLVLVAALVAIAYFGLLG